MRKHKSGFAETEDASKLIENLKVRALALKGIEDYVPAPPSIETIITGGGHMSPLEQPVELINYIQHMLN